MTLTGSEKFAPGTACPDCGAILHGYPCIHHNDGCSFFATRGSEPRTEAGRALLSVLTEQWGKPNDRLLREQVLAIEAEAAQPIDVERLAEALRASPSLLLEGDDKDRAAFAAHIAAEYARLSGEEQAP